MHISRTLSILSSFLCIYLHVADAKSTVSGTCTAGTATASKTSSCIYTGSPSTPTATVTAPLYRPTPGTPWQVVYTFEAGDTITPSPNYTVYDLDFSDPNVSSLKKAGKNVICYFSVGTAEKARDDFGCFQSADLGCNYGGDFTDEFWIDYTSPNVHNIMLHRLDLAKQRGCDAIEPDNVDAYQNNNGLGLTQQDSVDFLDFLSNAAHARGMSIGLKNAPDLVPTLTTGSRSDLLQFVVVEECIAQDFCDSYQVFIDNKKAVFSIEYRSGTDGEPLEGSANKNKDWSLAEQTAICNKWTAIKNGSPSELLSTVLKHYPDVDNKFTRTCPNVF